MSRTISTRKAREIRLPSRRGATITVTALRFAGHQEDIPPTTATRTDEIHWMLAQRREVYGYPMTQITEGQITALATTAGADSLKETA